jgi:hypothetical protein
MSRVDYSGERDDSGLLEHFNDHRRHAPEVAQSLPDWFIGDEIALVERYVNGELKLAIRRVDGGPRYDGVVIEACPEGRKFQTFGAGARRGGDGGRTDADGEESFVLPYHVEVMQSEKTIIPSTVRFQIFDDASRAIREPLFAFRHVQWINKIVEGRINGKVAISTRFFSVAPREGGSEQIEAGTHRIDDRTDFCAEDKGQGRIDPKLDQLLSHLRVRLFDQGIRWTVDPGFEALLKTFEMGYGPVGSGISV